MFKYIYEAYSTRNSQTKKVNQKLSVFIYSYLSYKNLSLVSRESFNSENTIHPILEFKLKRFKLDLDNLDNVSNFYYDKLKEVVKRT